MDDFSIRTEQPDDAVSIGELLEAAFGQPDERILVEQLREQGLFEISLVTLAETKIIGFVLFSRIEVETRTKRTEVLSLAPLAVHPDHQRKGIGAELVIAGIEAAKKSEFPGIFVLGDTHYYQRFGFSSELGAKFTSPFPIPEFMAIDLDDHFSKLLGGNVVYSKPFGIK